MSRSIALLMLLIGLAGCDLPAPTVNKPKGGGTAQERGLQPAAGQPNQQPGPAALGGNTPAPSQFVRLSAGTALPQTLPEGTAMSFSVDYAASQAGTPGASYIWVIHRAQGENAEVAVELKTKDNLISLQPGWRPEEAPFEAWIEERTSNSQPREVSARIPLS